MTKIDKIQMGKKPGDSSKPNTPRDTAEPGKGSRGAKKDKDKHFRQGSSVESLASVKASGKVPSPKPEDLSLFGNWTGKTPLYLLYEHNQRQDWVKPIIHVVRLSVQRSIVNTPF
jgi:hypothetical protein